MAEVSFPPILIATNTVFFVESGYEDNTYNKMKYVSIKGISGERYVLNLKIQKMRVGTGSKTNNCTYLGEWAGKKKKTKKKSIF